VSATAIWLPKAVAAVMQVKSARLLNCVVISILLLYRLALGLGLARW
jgi:hypothetical protein